MNASPDLPAPVRKFNPGTLQSDEDVTRQFAVRQAKLEIVLEVLRGNVDSPSCQHVLIVVPRGRGKTMLLARVAAELRTDRALAERLLPVRFMEESQEIFTLADFWLDTLFHLARETRQCDPELARELQEAHAELAAGWRGDDPAERVRAAVLDVADRLGRKRCVRRLRCWKSPRTSASASRRLRVTAPEHTERPGTPRRNRNSRQVHGRGARP